MALVDLVVPVDQVGVVMVVGLMEHRERQPLDP
jgi:hypothetical protein